MNKNPAIYYGITGRKTYSDDMKVDLDPYDSVISAIDSEAAWQSMFIQSAPNGSLLVNNSLFDEIDKNGELTLLHVTTAYEKMKQSGVIYPSGGSLGCTVYCAPLRIDGTMHNLTKFILNYELPKSLNARGLTSTANVDVIAIRISKETVMQTDVDNNGMDHLLLGRLQMDAYYRFLDKANISKDTQAELEQDVHSKITKITDFLVLCTRYELNDISDDMFFEKFYSLVDSCSFFGYVYFETLIEYLSLYQDDSESESLREIKEFNSNNSKRLIFEIAPHLLSSFRLPTFKPSIEEVSRYLQSLSSNDKFIKYFDFRDFKHFMKWRLAQNIRYKVMDSQGLELTSNFNELVSLNPSLVGHVIRTEIAQRSDLSEVAYLYDAVRADLICEGWNKYKVLFPYNSIIPKGEIGINPSFKNLKYKVCETSFNLVTGAVELKNELAIKLSPELIDAKHSTMRFQKEL